jgi:hypothetical protein
MAIEHPLITSASVKASWIFVGAVGATTPLWGVAAMR